MLITGLLIFKILSSALCSAIEVNCSEPNQPALLKALTPIFNLSAIRPVMNMTASTNVSISFTLYGILGVVCSAPSRQRQSHWMCVCNSIYYFAWVSGTSLRMNLFRCTVCCTLGNQCIIQCILKFSHWKSNTFYHPVFNHMYPDHLLCCCAPLRLP